MEALIVPLSLKGKSPHRGEAANRCPLGDKDQSVTALLSAFPFAPIGRVVCAGVSGPYLADFPCNDNQGETAVSELTHPEQINRDYVRLLQVMRRFVKEEFSVSIRMTQEDAVAQLLHYATVSRNHVLQEMGKELQEMTHSPSATATQADGDQGEHVRYYRGAAIVEEGSAAKPAKGEAEKGNNRPTRVYRGQVISN
jgi:hypothetical protein